MRVFVIITGHKDSVSLQIENPSNETVSNVKQRISQIVGSSNLRILYKGRVLDFEERTLDQVLEDGCSLYVSIQKPTAAQTTLVRVQEREDNSFQKMMMRKLQENLGNNPELFQSMMLQNPSVKAMTDKDPELRKRLMDPELAEQAINMAINPQAFHAFMQSQERAMSQIENMPQGFQYLRQMYRNVDTLSEPPMPASSSKLSSSQPKRGITAEPLSNPWAKHVPAPMLTKHEGQRFTDELNRLHEMGFMDDGLNLEALIAANGDFDVALDFIESKMEDME